MNKKNIGSKQAEKLAKQKHGPKAYAMRSGRRYYIGVLKWSVCRHFVGNIYGTGKSWAEALNSAGISIPVSEPYSPPAPVVPVEEVEGVGI